MKLNPLLSIVLATLFVTQSTIAFAEAWGSKAKTLFEKDEYQRVIDIAEDHKRDKDSRIGLMLLAFSHLQLYEFNNTKSDKKAFNNYMDLLEDYVNANHLNDIRFFIEQVDKPEVVSQGRKLLKRGFKNINNIDDMPLIVPFAKTEDEDTRKLAFSAIKGLVSSKRKYVIKGGTLREKDIRVMRGESLIRTLLDNIEISSAYNTLIDIEEPVLKYLEDYDGKKIFKLEEKIKKTIRKRQKKYPKSNWYSAIGKTHSF